MDRQRLLGPMIGLVLTVLFLSACGKTTTPTPSATAEIETTLGTLVIEDVQFADRFPPACDPGSPNCQQAQEGYQVLIVWLKRLDGGDPAAIGIEFFKASEEAYVIAGDSSRTDRTAGGLLQSRLFLAFTPRASAHDFKLFWPDNPAVDLRE